MREFLSRVDSAEIAELEAYDKLAPLDTAQRIELAVGRLAALTYNVHRGKNEDAATVPDFMSDWGWQYRDADAEAQKVVALDSKISQTFAAFTALGLKGRKPKCQPSVKSSSP